MWLRGRGLYANMDQSPLSGRGLVTALDQSERLTLNSYFYTTVTTLKDVWHEKTRVSGLSDSAVCMIIRLAVSVQFDACDRQAERRTNGHMTTAYSGVA